MSEMTTYATNLQIGQLARVDGDVVGTVTELILAPGDQLYVCLEWWKESTLHRERFHSSRVESAEIALSPPVPANGGDSGDLVDVEYAREKGSDMATFHSFKKSGKWYASGRAHLPPKFFTVFPSSRREWLLDHLPNRNYPGLSGPGRDLIWVIVPDESHSSGWPVMLRPEEEI